MVGIENIRVGVSRYMSEPKLFENPHQAMMNRYTSGYCDQDSDISEESRASIVHRAEPYIGQLGPHEVVLNIGAGKQLLERKYLRRNRHIRRATDQPQCQIITVDFADIEKAQLAATRFPNVRHMRASGEALPIQDSTVAVIISNMALEYMSEEALAEAHRVLVPGGRLFANIWTGEEYLQDWNEFTIDSNMSRKRREYLLENLSFWYQFIRSGVNTYFGSDSNQARAAFESHGFSIERLEQSGDREINWWELDAVKPSYQGDIGNRSAYTLAVSTEPVVVFQS